MCNMRLDEKKFVNMTQKYLLPLTSVLWLLSKITKKIENLCKTEKLNYITLNINVCLSWYFLQLEHRFYYLFYYKFNYYDSSLSHPLSTNCNNRTEHKSFKVFNFSINLQLDALGNIPCDILFSFLLLEVFNIS